MREGKKDIKLKEPKVKAPKPPKEAKIKPPKEAKVKLPKEPKAPKPPKEAKIKIPKKSKVAKPPKAEKPQKSAVPTRKLPGFLIMLQKPFRKLFQRFLPKNPLLPMGEAQLISQVKPWRTILFKLVLGFLVPVILMVILGTITFNKASSIIMGNYENSLSQTVNISKEYFNFAFTNIESDINAYLFSDNVGSHLRGENLVSEAEQANVDKYNEQLKAQSALMEGMKESDPKWAENRIIEMGYDKAYTALNVVAEQKKTNQKNIYNSINNELSSKVASNQFIRNIYIISKTRDKLSSEPELRYKVDSDQNAEEDFAFAKDLYTAFVETEYGKKVMSDKNSYHWGSPQNELNELYLEKEGDYCLRVAHAYTDAANSFILYDVNTSAIGRVLQSLKIGTGSITGIVAADGVEFLSEGSAASAKSSKEEKALKDNEVSALILKQTKELHKKGNIFSGTSFYKNAVKSKESSGFEYVDHDGSDYLFMYSKIGETGNVLCALVPKSSIVGQVSGIRYITILLVVFASIIALLIGIIIARGISNMINYTIRKLSKAAQGDLTVTLTTKRQDEFALLANSTTGMLSNMRALIVKLEQVYHSFLESLNTVNDTSGTFSNTTKDIQTAVHEIEIGINQQSEDAAQCLMQMDSLFAKINVVNENTVEIGSIADSTNKAIAQGITTMNDLNDKTHSTTQITNSVISAIAELEKKSRNISQIINAINDIAEETNLLSLNASIEAAKAGDAGRGFAVVADQIRKLADQSLNASSRIGSIIEEIVQTTKQAVITAKEAETIVNLQVNAVENTSDSFNEMNKHIDELTKKLKLIQESSRVMEEAGSATLNSMESISSILQETSASATNVAATVDRQTDALGDLDKASEKLVHRSGDIEVAIKQFKTK